MNAAVASGKAVGSASPAAQPLRIERDVFGWCATAVAAALLPLAPALPLWFSGLVLGIVILSALCSWRGLILSGWLRLPLTLGTAGAALFAYNFQIGRDTGCALLAAMLALKLLELRRPRDARSVLSYGLFAIMAAFLQDQSPRTFLLALLATTLILAALARVAQLAPRPAPWRAAWRERVGSAALLALLSLPLAVVGFFLFPRLGSPLWGLPGNAGEARTGLSDSMSPGDMVELFADDNPALRVQFFGTPPPQADMYWRGPVLTDFDGRTWSRWHGSVNVGDLPSIDYRLPKPEPLGPSLEYEIVQEPTDRRYLVALDLPIAAPDGMRMAFDGTLYAQQRQIDLSRYRATSVTRYRFEPRLLDTFRRNNLTLPEGFNPRTAALIASWKAENPSPEALAQRALSWFNQEFTYTLRPQPLGRHSVDEFLFDTQEGYCEYFSSAFVVMMRMAGVPARVVTGYQGAERNEIGDYWVVRHSDAHAWSEIWLESRGWVRVDPTGAVSPARIEQGSGVMAGEEAVWDRLGGPFFQTADWLRRNWNDLVLGFNASRQRDLLQLFGLRDGGARDFGLALAFGVALALALTLGLLLRQRPVTKDPMLRAYAAFTARLGRAGVSRAVSEGPLNYANRAAAALPQVADDVHALSRRYVRWRYAAPESNQDEETALREALRRFRIPRAARRTDRSSA
jgi:transglutaminase-like putative cysteine protease